MEINETVPHTSFMVFDFDPIERVINDGVVSGIEKAIGLIAINGEY